MRNIVLGVIGSDSHVVGITILDHALTDAGYRVENIGVQASQEDFIEAAKEVDADAILVSSLYGHAEADCEGFTQKIREEELDVVTYIGGNLTVGTGSTDEAQRIFLDMGFDKVFTQEADPEDLIESLQEESVASQQRLKQ